MAQAIMDPDEVRRFAKELKRFNDDLTVKAGGLQARFTALASTWQDQENIKFAEEFVQEGIAAITDPSSAAAVMPIA